MTETTGTRNSMAVVVNRTHAAGSPEAVRIVRAWIADEQRRRKDRDDDDEPENRGKPKGPLVGIEASEPHFMNSYGGWN